MNVRTTLLSTIVMTIMVFGAFMICIDSSDISAEAIGSGTSPSDPYTYVFISADECGAYFTGTKYVAAGTSFEIDSETVGSIEYYIDNFTDTNGLTVAPSGSLYGTLTGNNGDVVTFNVYASDGYSTGLEGTYSFTVVGRYTVTWENYDGTVLETDTNVLYGTNPTYNGTNPSRSFDGHFTYTFNGWNPSPSPVTGNIVYTAKYTKTLAFNITGSGTLNDPYTEISIYANNSATYFTGTKYVETGTPVFILINTVSDVEYYIDNFTAAHGLSVTSGTLSGTVTGNNGDVVTFNVYASDGNSTGLEGTYSLTILDPSVTYTITWNNWDGNALETDTGVTWGSSPSYNGATPTKDSNEYYTYSFKGWSPTPSTVTGNQTYTAQYSAIPIIRVDGEGSPDDRYEWVSIYAKQVSAYFSGTVYVETGSQIRIYYSDEPEIDMYVDNFTQAHGLSVTSGTLSGTVTGNNGDVVTFNVYASDGNSTGLEGTYSFTIIDPSVTYTITWENYDGTLLETDTDITYAIIPHYDGATPTKPPSGDDLYTFVGWNPEPNNVTGNETYTAQFRVIGKTYWSNGNPNGSISILYHIDSTNLTNSIITTARLLRFDPSISDDTETQYNESFIDTGYYLKIEVTSVRVGNSYDAQVTAKLYDENDNLITQGNFDFGSWSAFIITLDTLNGNVSYTKVMQFRSFTDYEESISGNILTYGDNQVFTGLSTYELRMMPLSDEVPRQSIVKTSVFLNTYGVVLIDPTIDISQYFPEMNDMRLNFYSFALYGQSITINGHSMMVTAPNITLYYRNQSGTDVKLIEDAPGDNIITNTLELKNIYVTWVGTHCYLTFADDNITIDMGSYINKKISFNGMWYFATALYDPYTVTETVYEMDWWHTNFDMADFGMVMAIILIFLALISKATIGGKTIDYVIVGFGIIVALIIAGGVINA